VPLGRGPASPAPPTLVCDTFDEFQQRVDDAEADRAWDYLGADDDDDDGEPVPFVKPPAVYTQAAEAFRALCDDAAEKQPDAVQCFTTEQIGDVISNLATVGDAGMAALALLCCPSWKVNNLFDGVSFKLSRGSFRGKACSIDHAEVFVDSDAILVHITHPQFNALAERSTSKFGAYTSALATSVANAAVDDDVANLRMATEQLVNTSRYWRRK
jgi:hypothetical protein